MNTLLRNYRTIHFTIGFEYPLTPARHARVYWNALECGAIFWHDPKEGYPPYASDKWYFNRTFLPIELEWHLPAHLLFADSPQDLLDSLEAHFPHAIAEERYKDTLYGPHEPHT